MKNATFLSIVVASMLIFFTACSGQKSKKGNPNTVQTNEGKSAKTQEVNLSPHALQGKKIAKRTGCMNCHTTNGKDLVGPTFKNMYGHQSTMKDGSTIVVDSLYVIQSLKHPSKKITAGYSPVMPKYDFLSELRMENIVAYLRAISNTNLEK